MKKQILFLVSSCIIFTACAQDNKDEIVTIHTSLGDIKVLLYEQTPLHKANFIQLAKESQYDSTVFHRVIQYFMIQGGGIDEKNGTTNDTTIPAEIVDGLYHQKGALAAARMGDQVNPKKASSYCQYYIVHGKKFTEAELTIDQSKLNQAIGQIMRYESNASMKAKFDALQEKGDVEAMNQLALTYVEQAEKQLNIKLKKEIVQKRLDIYSTIGGTPHLDGNYTVFGKVVAGLAVVDKIAAVETGGGDRPVNNIYMTMEVERLSKKKITKLYGYHYPKK